MGKPPEEQRTTAEAPVSPLEKQIPTIDLQELIRQQGTKPFDPEEFSKGWPEEFDPDAFDAWLKEERSARRAHAARNDR